MDRIIDIVSIDYIDDTLWYVSCKTVEIKMVFYVTSARVGDYRLRPTPGFYFNKLQKNRSKSEGRKIFIKGGDGSLIKEELSQVELQ